MHLKNESLASPSSESVADSLASISNVVVFGPASNCTLQICDINWSVYKYRPSLAANMTFLALFSFAMGIHIALGIRWRSWWFMAFMISGCLFEMIGYGGRLILYHNPFSFTGFLVQIITITGAPVFFTAAIYVTLSKTIEHFSAQLSPIRPKLFYYFFIPADIICLILQASGGAISTVSRGISQRGIDIAMVGLVLQVFVLVIFIGLFGDYMHRYIRSQVTRKFSAREINFFIFLALATVLILGRCAYRCYELKEGYAHSHLITDEGLFIGLEGVLIYVATLSLCIGHPGLIFHGKNRDNMKTSDASNEHIPLQRRS